jgi:hypothetical protein
MYLDPQAEPNAEHSNAAMRAVPTYLNEIELRTDTFAMTFARSKANDALACTSFSHNISKPQLEHFLCVKISTTARLKIMLKIKAAIRELTLVLYPRPVGPGPDLQVGDIRALSPACYQMVIMGFGAI